jgi:hypothetical protein
MPRAGDQERSAPETRSDPLCGVIVNCATSNKGDVMATQTLLGAAVRATAAHIVYVSIVGIEHIAKRGYPKAKLECEELVSGSGQPWTILRATQFYEYVLGGFESWRDCPSRLSQPGSASSPSARRTSPLASRLSPQGSPRPGCPISLAPMKPAERACFATTRASPIDTHRTHPSTQHPGGPLGSLVTGAGHDVGNHTWQEYLLNEEVHDP